MGAKASTEQQQQRPRTFSTSEGATHSHNNNHNSGTTATVATPLARGNSNPFSTSGEGTRVPVRGRSYSSSAMQSHSAATGILELSGRINSFASAGFWPVSGIRCPICNKMPDDIEIHLVMCLTRPRINYNEDVLIESKDDECVICLEEMLCGETIARLPCLCIFHKHCIDRWFQVNRSCPEHPYN